MLPSKKNLMRYIQKLFIASLIFAGFTGCRKEFLTLDPIDQYSYYNFPTNESQVEQAVVGCYRKVYPIYNNYMWIWGDMLSDNTSFRFNPSDRGGIATEQLDEFVANAQEGNIGGMYRESFEGVQRSNYVLQSLADIPFASDSVKGVREAEARFFRAFHYFNLVRLYGDIPIVTRVVTEPDPNTATNYPRRSVQQVYDDVILPDVQVAIAKLPNTVPSTQAGRLVKNAARVLLAKALMTQRRFSEALPILNQITGYSLQAQYVNNFNPLTKNGVESIFEIQTFPVPSGYSFTFMGSWTPWGTGTTIWPGGSNSRGGLNQPTNDLNNAYETNDNRKAITLGSTGTGPGTILFIRKFLYWDAAARLNPCQWPVYRFADVLLMQAECLNEAGFVPNGPAFAALNQVRTRAGLPNKTQGNANPALAVNDQAAFRLAVEQERRIEFAGEGHRWFDLVRTGRATQVMTAHGAAEKLIKTTLDPAAYTNIKLLLGIPFREIQQFGYPQNTGW
jgi:starch-binding outer membrane protein, SusD/RagB family